jgi:hypothetical protein
VEVPSDASPAFYVQPGAHVSTRVPIPLGRGDLVAHSYDLQHGVEVSQGRRASVIMWFTDSMASCIGKTRPWYRGQDAAAQFNRAKDLCEREPAESRALMEVGI